MISNLWIDTRKDNWNRLDALTTRVETDGVKSLGREDLRDFGLLYRQAAADLSGGAERWGGANAGAVFEPAGGAGAQFCVLGTQAGRANAVGLFCAWISAAVAEAAGVCGCCR